jgi:two-component system, NarL family, sensor kinase
MLAVTKMTRSARAGFALSTAAAALLLAALALSLPVLVTSGATGDLVRFLIDLFGTVLVVLGGAVFGTLILARYPRHALGWLFCVVALAEGGADFSQGYAMRSTAVGGPLPAGAVAAWLGDWVQVLSVPLLATLGLLLFPDGRLPSKRWLPVLWLAVVGLVGTVVSQGFTAGPLQSVPQINNPFGFLPESSGLLGVPVVVAMVLCATSLLARYRGAGAEVRQQLRWMALAAVLVVLSLIATLVIDGVTRSQAGWPLYLGAAGVMVASGVAVLGYHLWDLNVVVNRTLVYGSLTATIGLGYAAIVVLFGQLLDRSIVPVSLVATLVAALAILPLRSALQRWVNRLMYGARDEPYAVLAQLGDRLGHSAETDSVLTAIVETICEALRLPYAAIELQSGDTARVAAAYGAAEPPTLVRLPLEYHGVVIGRLAVAPRSPTEPLHPRDLQLLRDLAIQAGAAVHSLQLTEDLRRSRERLVTSREEERRRMRRDLHDGLGPTLAAISLGLDTIRRRAKQDGAAANAMLGDVAVLAHQAVSEIRRIANDLRPTSLDQLGLINAVREYAARIEASAPLAIDVESPDDLSQLPAAVEVAAYRIAVEAVTNVVRHARATSCSVRFGMNGALELEVRDDGRGVDGKSGVGLLAMKERAEELGGTLLVRSTAGSGTTVLARLPLAPDR